MVLFDLGDVKERAARALSKNKNDPEESRQIYLEEIMDWTDYYTENLINNPETSDERKRGFRAIVDLWLQCAQFEIGLHQFKKAVDVFEQAVGDPIAKDSGLLYQAYADFCVDRKKLANAQKVYIKGLCGNLSAIDSSNLWNNFLGLMRTINKNNSLTLEQLFVAVQQQLGEASSGLAPLGGGVTPAVQNELTANESKVDDSVASEAAVVKVEVDEVANSPELEETPVAAVPGFAAPDDLDRVAGLTPEQIVGAYDRRPPMIFSAPNKEPMASGISGLGAAEVVDLERYLGCSLQSLSASGNHWEDRVFGAMTAADKHLDLLELMWCAQALKERHFDSWMSDLSQLHAKEESELLAALISKEQQQKGGASSEGEMRSRHQQDLRRFSSRCAVQKELLNAVINKTQFALLLEQQACLAEAGFPRFSPAFTARIVQHLASRRAVVVGADRESIQREFESICEHVRDQQRLVCAVLSTRLSAIQQERSRAQSNQRQQRLSLARDAPMDLGEDGSDTPGGSSGGDFYSLEAKKNRKRRRLISQRQQGESYSQSAVNSYGNNAAGSPRQLSGGVYGSSPEQQQEWHLLGHFGAEQSPAEEISPDALPLLQKLATILQEVKRG